MCQKSPWPPAKPKSLGNCVATSTSATPVLNPTSTVSEIKLTTTPARTTHATSAIAATRMAVHAASDANRCGSPPARPPSDVPISSEIAEVTVIAVWRELQNSQNTRPEKRQAYSPASGGRPASDASPRPAGSR